jgi:hypothetical protein
MAENYANYVTTTLNGGITDVATTATLTDGTGFPTANFRILIEDELILVGSRSGTALSSMTRGAEGTTNVAHVDTTDVHHILTAGAIDQIRADSFQEGNFSSFAAAQEGNLYQPDDTLVALRDTGAALNPIFPNMRVTSPPTAGWSWDNQDLATITAQDGYLALQSGNTTGFHVRYRTASAAPYTIVIGAIKSWNPAATGVFQGPLTFGWRESDTGKLVTYQQVFDHTNVPRSRFTKWTDTATVSAQYTEVTDTELTPCVSHNPTYIKLEDNNTNLIASVSYDYGLTYYQFDSRARTDFLASAGPNQVCFGVQNDVAGSLPVGLTIFHWLET